MNQFDYAQSNSLLKREIEDHSTDNESLPERSSPDINGIAHTSMAQKKKIIPAKKSQKTKHKTIIDKAISNVASATVSNPETETKSETETGTVASMDDVHVNPNTSDTATKTQSKKPARKPRVRKPRRPIPNEKQYIPENEQPTQADVVGGRGGRSNHHPGNRPYWIRILESRTEYTKSRSDHEKSRIATGILKYVQDELRGRFLNIDSKTKRWYILPNTVVLDKIKQALRDKYIPYWARDLKIEDKKHNPLDSMLATKGTAAGNSALQQSIVNKRPQLGLDSMLPLGSSYANMHNSNTIHPMFNFAGINASRADAVTTSLPKTTATSTAGTTPGTVNNTNNSTNKLGFLFGGPARQSLGRTAAIPTIDDILKCKIDQMPSFGGVSNAGLVAAAMSNAPPPPQAQLTSLGLNPFQSNFPPALMTSLGLGGFAGNGGMLNDALNQNHGFGAGGNLGAPAVPATTLPASLGVLQNLSMKSLDNYLEERLAEKIAALPPALAAPAVLASQGFSAANLLSLSRSNALAGTSFDSAASHAPAMGLAAAFGAPVAAAPTGPKKTDWNAMFARALTNSK